jgi:hypothetical protein
MGISSLAFTWLLAEERLRAAPAKPPLEPRVFDLAPKPPHYAPRAKAMISLYMQGGPSHIDLFEPKPILDKYDGKKYQGEMKIDSPEHYDGTLMASPWKFSHHGQCGTELSELLPNLGNVVDDIAVIRSTQTGVNNHGQSIQALNTGRTTSGHPSLGSWITYGLGSECQNLPAYMALIDPGQIPVMGVENWGNGWLPSLYQGTVVRPREPRILNLDAPPEMKGAVQESYLSLVQQLDKHHLERHPGESDLSARIASYELAARMQLSAKEALDISGESDATKKLYGLDDPTTAEYGTRCMIARRLVERGVRFVQVFTANQFWDHHFGIRKSLPAACAKVDKPSAALVQDLKSRGLLDTTLVHWGGEMGRLPVIQNGGPSKIGRDHNTYGFTMWLAGGGIKGGITHGATDDFGHRAAVDVVTHHDYHATLLHLFGLDPKRLTFLRNAREQNLLDDQPGKVVTKLLA